MRTAELSTLTDPRLRAAGWDPTEPARLRRRARRLAVVGAVLIAWYVGWLLQPGRIGNGWLFALLVAAELFNVAQAAGFWWTCLHAGRRRPVRRLTTRPDVDVLVPVYDEPVRVVLSTIVAATRIRGARVHVTVCDDGDRDELRDLAGRLGVGYLRRPGSRGAKAGNLNHALRRTHAPFVAVFDCDHVPDPRFLQETLGHFRDPAVAFVQTPQYYANADRSDIAGAAWEQQALFFGPIARGKDGLDAMFCAGTNVVFRRTALEEVGGYPEDSVTEDFELSVRLHERRWRSVYVPQVLARGLGPEDTAGYVGQQDRWARGCIAAIRTTLRADLPWRLKAQYLLSSSFFLTGWTVLVYLSLPVIRLVTGHQPLAEVSADRFIVHFAPYFGMALLAVSVAGGSTYSFRAYAVMIASFWIHIRATVAALLGLGGGFTVTPKEGTGRRQPGAVAPGLLVVAVLAGVSVWALLGSRSPATLNNVAFAVLHITVLGRGVWPALRAPLEVAVEEPLRAPASAA